MRKLLRAILIVSVVGTVGWHLSADLGARAETFKLKVALSGGKAADKRTVFISTGGAAPTELGITTAAGELEIALDPSKNGEKYNVYDDGCGHLILHEVGTSEVAARAWKQDDESKKCGAWVLLGQFSYNVPGTVGTFSGGHTVRNTAIVVSAIALPALGIAAGAGGGGTEGVAVTPVTPIVQTTVPPAPAPNPFVSLDGTYPNVIFVLQPGSCAGFNPQFTGTITVTGHSSDAATAIVRIVESIVREYRGVFRNRIYEGAGSGTFASGRPWTGQVSFSMADGSVRNVREVLNVGASATSPACPATYAQP